MKFTEQKRYCQRAEKSWLDRLKKCIWGRSNRSLIRLLKSCNFCILTFLLGTVKWKKVHAWSQTSSYKLYSAHLFSSAMFIFKLKFRSNFLANLTRTNLTTLQLTVLYRSSTCTLGSILWMDRADKGCSILLIFPLQLDCLKCACK